MKAAFIAAILGKKNPNRCSQYALWELRLMKNFYKLPKTIIMHAIASKHIETGKDGLNKSMCTCVTVFKKEGQVIPVKMAVSTSCKYMLAETNFKYPFSVKAMVTNK